MTYSNNYAYHIKDEYFEKVQDSKLMQSKENGRCRPTFYCMRDESTSLLWMVPLSSQIEKYRRIHDQQVRKYGRSLTIIIGEFDGKETASLLQNMFPIREYYIDHVHTHSGNPVPVKASLQKKIKRNMKRILRIHESGKKIVFPDIDRLACMMIAEMQ